MQTQKMLLVALLGFISLGAGVSARSLLQQSNQCFGDSSLMGMDLFVERALACSPLAGEEHLSQEACCEKVRGLFGHNAVLDKCLCDAQYFTAVTSQLPVNDGLTVEQFISDMTSCGIPVKGDHHCGGGHEDPLVMAMGVKRKFLLGGLVLKKAFGSGYGVGSALGGGGGGYGYGGPIVINNSDDDDDDDDGGGARPVAVPPFSPVPSPSPPPPPPPPPLTPPPAGGAAPPPPPPPAGGTDFFGGGGGDANGAPAPGAENGNGTANGDDESFGFFG